MTHATDHIERETLLKAPRAQVWRALSRPSEFGQWFGVAFRDGEIRPGELLQGRVTTPGYDHLLFEAWIEQVEPERRLSFRWHPDAGPAGMARSLDPAQDPTTLVSFELSDVAGGTWLRILETGYDSLPPERRLKAYRENSQGWDEQLRNIAAHVEASLAAS